MDDNDLFMFQGLVYKSNEALSVPTTIGLTWNVGTI